MRKTVAFLFGGLFVVLALVSCSSENSTLNSTPPVIGTITLNQIEDIRPGQRVVASTPLPSGGENIRSLEKSWEVASFLGKSGIEEDGRAYIEFYAPSTAGKYSIMYKVRCIYEGVNSIGEHLETLTAETSFEVVTTDIFSSKWTDTPQITQRAYLNVKKTDDDTQYVMDAEDVLDVNNSKIIKRYFLYKNNVLYEIREVEDIEMDGTESDQNCYRMMVKNRIAANIKLHMEYGESYAIDAATGNKITDIPLEGTSSEEMKVYTEKLYSGELKEVCFMLFDDVTSLVIKGQKTDKGIRITRSYMKK
ncbi:MAG: hypothetical protein ACI4BA_08755 [Prevotella sp.]